MIYSVRNEFTIGDYEVGWNTDLSATDKEYIGTVYPLEVKPSVELQIGARAKRASIGKHGEEDLFQFTVPEAGRYLLQTRGLTNVAMSLFGPDSQTALITEDDDSGWWTNARIVKDLVPGTYYALVRHSRPTGKGRYSIKVQKVD
jgi:hypothetical protein